MARSRNSQRSKATAYWRVRPRTPCWRKSCAGWPRTSADTSLSITTKPACFYYNKARLQLRSRNAQRLTSFIIRNFWLPGGGGVKPDSEVDWILSFILGDPQGLDIARRID